MPLTQKKLIPSILVLLALTALAAPPTWWGSGNPPVIDSAAVGNNQGPANIGQAKHMVKSAIVALRTVRPTVADQIEADLTTGPNPILNLTVPNPKTTQWQEKQKNLLLIGQLKAIAAPFYTRLHAASPTWLEAERITNGTNYPGSIFPWTAVTTDDANKAIANIGQLKAVFSLRFNTLVSEFTDTDGDGVTDIQESAHGFNPNNSADVISSTTVNATINGNTQANQLYGGSGNDKLYGSSGYDIYYWNLGNGNDFVLDSVGSSRIVLGTGITPAMIRLERDAVIESTYLGWQHKPSYNEDLKLVVVDPANPINQGVVIDNWKNDKGKWTIEFPSGVIWSGAYLPTLGVDNFAGGTTNDTISGSEGNDILDGNSGNDILFGDEGDDNIEGGNGDDQLTGGPGNDYLKGETANDTYYWNLGDGNDYVYDIYGANRVVLGPGITPAMIRYERDIVNGATYQGWQNDPTVDQDLKLVIVDPANPVNQGLILDEWKVYKANWTIQFHSGLIVQGAFIGTQIGDTLNGGTGADTMMGAAGDDFIDGKNGNDILFGDEGNDTIEGGDGNDQLTGVTGNDILKGESGNDTYYWNLGDGIDYAEDSIGQNVLVLGAGITPAMVAFDLASVTSANFQGLEIPTENGTDLWVSITHPTNPSLSGSFVINDWATTKDFWSIAFEAVDPATGSPYLSLGKTVIEGLVRPWDGDMDTIPDWWERLYGLQTNADNRLIDTDLEGLFDDQEFLQGTDPTDVDTDDDLVSDYEELFLTFTDPLTPTDVYQLDYDGDGLSNGLELSFGSDVFEMDSNGDNVIDGVTYSLGLNPASLDPDGDGLNTEQERALGTSSVHADTDGDGANDNVDPDPLDPAVGSPVSQPGDSVAPDILLILPSNATEI